MEDMDKEVAVTIVQFLLSPEVPMHERAYFQRFYVMFSKIAALGNIKRSDILSFKITFKMIAVLLENGIYEYAHELMAEFLMTIQLTRSVGGFWTLFGQRGIERTEHIESVMQKAQQPSRMGRLRSAFSGRKSKGDSLEEGYE